MIRWRFEPQRRQFVDNCGFGSDFFPGSGGFMPPSLTMFFAAPLLWVTRTLQVLTKNLNLDAPSAHTQVKAVELWRTLW